jgi:hypothetical protein
VFVLRHGPEDDDGGGGMPSANPPVAAAVDGMDEYAAPGLLVEGALDSGDGAMGML